MPDKIVLEHNGALGDFLLAWPVALALARAFPKIPAYALAAPSRLRWLAPLGYAPCQPELRRELSALYGASSWPASLDRTLVVRPGLFSRPDIPESDNFHFLPGVRPGAGPDRFDPPALLYREGLARMGLAWPENGREVFQEHFGRNAPAGQTVLLFPGAGHPFKRWPLKRYLELAALLEERGFSPVLVLGPAEIEAGLSVPERLALRPESLEELEGLLLSARAAVGNDSGPMHLAGMLGVPGLAIFGPTSPGQWGPGLPTIAGDKACAPCARITAGDFPGACPFPDCLARLGVNDVVGALLPILTA